MINEPQGKSNTERHGQNDSSGTVANAVQGRRGKFNAVLNCTQKPSGFFQSWKNILTWLEEMQVRESVQLGTVFDALKTTLPPHELPPHISDIRVNRLQKLQRILVKHTIDIDHLHPCIFRFLHLADTKMAVILQGLSLAGRMPRDITPGEKKLFLICIFARIGKIPDDYPRYTTPDELITAVLGEETQDTFIERHSRYTGPSDVYSWMEQGTNAAQPHTLRDYINLTLWEEPRFRGIFKVEKMNELYGAFAIKMILWGRGKKSKELEKILSKIQGNTTTQEQALANWILFLKSNFTPGMTVAQFIAQELDKMNSENISR